MTDRTLITTDSPFENALSYSRAVVQGDWCFMAGVTGYDYTTMTMPPDIATQTKNCLDTIERVLSQAGFALSQTARVQYTLSERGLVDDFIPVVGLRFKTIRPAATIVFAELLKPEMLVEIEITAFKG
ncbi:MAG: RidA family protein [Candidatus Halichondribacter symbioticus]